MLTILGGRYDVVFDSGVVEEGVPARFLRRFDAAPVVLRLLRKGCRLDDASLARLLDDDARLWRA